MAINTELVGKVYGPSESRYDPAGHDSLRLGDRGRRVRPRVSLREARSEASIRALPPSAAGTGNGDLITDLNIDPMMIIHGEQRVRHPRCASAQRHRKTEATVAGIYDKGSGALVDLELKSSVGGKLLFENVVSMFVRGEGGFGGERGPKRDKAQPPDRAPDKRVKIQTERRQALMYRLSGDWNPLHADPDIAKAGGVRAPHSPRSVYFRVHRTGPPAGNSATMTRTAIRTMAVRFSLSSPARRHPHRRAVD